MLYLCRLINSAMKNWKEISFLLLLQMVFVGCNLTKFVPQDQYLLNKAKVEVTDTKKIPVSSLTNYLRQTQNSEVLGFWKLQLHIYNTAPSDTTTKSKKRLARNAQRLGEAPEIYDESLTRASMEQLTKAMHNLGYFQCKVDTQKVTKGQKMNVTYRITAGEPYLLREVSYVLPQTDLKQAVLDEKRTLLREGEPFDANVLDEERQRIMRQMRHQGYFNLDKSMLRFLADSSTVDKQVDVEIRLQDYIEQMSDSDFAHLFTKYTIRNVCFHMDYDPQFIPDSVQLQQKVDDGYQFTWVGKQLMRVRALKQNCAIKPGDFYDELKVERTYEWLNHLGIVKYVDISFREVGSDELDCHIVMSRSKLNTVSANVEGTYTSGDWGVSAGLGYINRNIFHGAEELQVNVGGGYEWRQNGGHAVEAKADAMLSFPSLVKVNVNFRYQARPDEFTRTISNAGLGYTLRHYRKGWTHSFQFLDISYVYVPWMSEEFKNRFVTNRNPLKYSYTSHFIEAISYSGQYSGYRKNHPLDSYAEARFFVEAAGNAMYGIAKAANIKQQDGVYMLGNAPFAQYTKADISATYTHIINEKHRLAYHAAIGVAVPYGNSSAIPYEKRYFAGGSNHVRGWTARSLGPGGYRGKGSNVDYDSQTGDIHLDLSMEYRWKVWSVIELAAFTDAGNIWTIREYETQPHGAFKWNSFYKEIAWSYGCGLRLDFTFLIFRVDFGVKLYDPSRLYEDGKVWRTVPNGLKWSDDMTFHFAIGHPF